MQRIEYRSTDQVGIEAEVIEVGARGYEVVEDTAGTLQQDKDRIEELIKHEHSRHVHSWLRLW